MRLERFFSLLLLYPLAAAALTAEAPLPDAAREAHAQRLFYEFRCVVCQGESLAESDAPLAQDIRNDIRRQVASGKSDAFIRDDLKGRFGEFILMKPPFIGRTALLWLAPALLLVAGAMLMRRLFRKPVP